MPTHAICAIFLLFTLASLPAAAQEQPAATLFHVPNATEPASTATQTAPPPQQQIDELKRQMDVLAAEVERLRSGEPEARELSDERRRSLGLSPSAAATYRRAGEGVSFAGYGEMLLENFAGETTRLDLLRAVVYAGYRFNDRFLFNSEIEFEHAGEEVGVEFAYLDYMINPHLTVRGGMVLLPLGLVNEFHEPTVFLGARRPETERRILPSTWHENGAGLIGSFGLVNFRTYVVNGLKASGFTSAGIRDGRQGGAEASAENAGVAGRIDVTPVPGIFGGVGLYTGGSGQDEIVTADGDRADIGTTIVEAHGQAQMRGFDVRALFAQASIGGAGDLTRQLRLASGLTPAETVVAERMRGGYLQVGYNVLSQSKSSLALLPYVRYEHVDTQHRVPVGFARDLSRDGEFKTLGVELKPIPNVVIKSDYQWITNRAGTGGNQFNMNLGYAF